MQPRRCAPPGSSISLSISGTRAWPRRCSKASCPSTTPVWSRRWRSKTIASSCVAASERGSRRSDLEALAALPGLHGTGDEVWEKAERVLGATRAAGPLAELARSGRWLEIASCAPKLVIDLGETWNFTYYTGMMFQILAEGPGAAVGSGGRYDGLLGALRRAPGCRGLRRRSRQPGLGAFDGGRDAWRSPPGSWFPATATG